MKITRFGWCLILLFVASTSFAQVSREDFFTGGVYPWGLAFDGTHIWVSNSDNVSELRSSDGVNLGIFAAGRGSEGLIFDDANIWVTSIGDNTTPGTLVKLRASDGVKLGEFTVGIYPRYVVFDGASVWVTNQTSNTVTKVRASDGAILGTFAVGSEPQGVTFDGTNIWVANGGDGSVTKLRASDGANLGTISVSNQGDLYAIAFDGTDIWITSNTVVKKLSTNDGSILAVLSNASDQPCGGEGGLAFDGVNMWVTNACANTVTRFRASDGDNLGTFAVGSYPIGVVFDGRSVWTANEGDGTVTKLTVTDEAFVQSPIEPDGSSVFSATRGVVPLKFTFAENGVPTCAMPPATIAISRTGDGTVGSVSPSVYETSADVGANFRIDPVACQYVYNVAASSVARSLGRGKYRVDISVNGFVVGSAVFTLQ